WQRPIHTINVTACSAQIYSHVGKFHVKNQHLLPKSFELNQHVNKTAPTIVNHIHIMRTILWKTNITKSITSLSGKKKLKRVKSLKSLKKSPMIGQPPLLCDGLF